MADEEAGEWIGAAEAARRLGIKQATLYAYVSRGVLARRTGPDGRSSMFDPAEIEVLARRGRPRGSAVGGEFVIESALTEITGERLRFRGLEAVDLAANATLEDVAGLLWTGALGEAGGAWHAAPDAVAAGAAAQASLPERTLPLERLQVIVAAMAATDPLRLHLEPEAVTAAGRAIVVGMAECLPRAATASARDPRREANSRARGRAARADPAGVSVAARLWPKLCSAPASPGMLGLLRSALVLLADHELAASTLAARVAASVRADPYAVVGTGLGALGGALHGGASLGAQSMLAQAQAPSEAADVVGRLLRRGERVPGFGHFVYRSGDPRARFLLDGLRAVAAGSGRLAVAEAVVAEMVGRGLPAPNVDFALAALADVAGMTTGAGEAVFAVARAVGWIGHALEEYARRTPLRPRARYTGPPASAIPGAARARPGGFRESARAAAHSVSQEPQSGE